MLTFTTALAAIPASAVEPVIDFPLDESLKGTVAGEEGMALPGEGAQFIESAEGSGIEPSAAGPAIKVPLPDEVWKPAGTLAFRFRLSRTIRFNPERPGAVMVKCPIFTLNLAEDKGHPVLTATMVSGGSKPETKEEQRELAAATRGRLFWSHLKGGEWYHLAFSWDTAKGRMEIYLNGVLQQEMRLVRRWQPWTPPGDPSGPLEIGGVIAPGESEARIAIDSVRLYPEFMNETQAAALLKGRPNFPLTGEGRWELAGSLDLSSYTLTPVYETEFDEELNWIAEDDLFKDDTRARLPKGRDWVLEGPAKARAENGRCIVTCEDHAVLWNTREFPENFLLEFGMSPIDSNIGLTIIFFSTRSIEGGSPFALNVPRRGGIFKNYHSGFLNGYHTSYFATNPADGGILRRTTNLRKNKGFYMPAAGIDRIGGTGPGPHRVRLLKVGGRIRVETRGRLALVFDDDGETYGEAWTHPGWIGLRQMGHTRQVAYTHFKVWEVEPARPPR